MTWIWYALITTLAWGVWGALIDLPGLPGTFNYVVWSLTMIPCALVALSQRGWRLELSLRAVVQGCLVGFLGAGGQLVLFEALTHVPPYIVFPIVSLYPVLTVLLSTTLLGERGSKRQWIGVAIAVPAIGLLSYIPPDPSQQGDASPPPAASSKLAAAGIEPLAPPGIPDAQPAAREPAAKIKYQWLTLAVIVFAAWGLQAYFMKTATQAMSPEGLFVYMAATGLLLAPVAIAMTTLQEPIEWNPLGGLRSVWAVAAIQVLNAIGALTLVHAMKTGKAMVVAPLTSLAPVITVLLSLAINRKMPPDPHIVGLVLASIAIYLLAE
ncbi:MAG: DMT family transporter [Pirellulales bacterium]|nr:DMT family transporter [Pirellulales bacterium]